MAHMRGCAKYKATLKKEKSENNEIRIEIKYLCASSKNIGSGLFSMC